MKLLNILFFLLAFSIEVKVKANGVPEESAFVTEPNECLEENSFCTIRSVKKYAIQEDEFRISMKTDTVLTRQNPALWSFVNGQIFVKANSKITFKTIYGEFLVEPGTQALLQKNEKSYSAQVLFGKVIFKGIGHKQDYAVLAGFENFLSQVDNSMKSEIGVPKPVILETVLQDWNYHFAGTKKQFLEELEKFRPILENAKKELSELNQEIVKRELASIKEQESKRKRTQDANQKLKSKNQHRAFDRLLGE